MKGNIKITQLDYLRISKLIQAARNDKSIEVKNLTFLANELYRAEKVDSKSITPEFVTMNSVVQVINEETKSTMMVKIVYPHEADFKKKYVSVLSPLGSALLGYKVGDIVQFSAPKGEVDITIQRIEYQPEADGKYNV
ncbi:regulator of nucleoside diphosphate kinase [Draconibacterium orientale]|uniref:GreA/GreB family elongation factor n=1 Tax=Draconibacterium orientale TaxID=1168034 RepID=X5D7C3_9BACT|nr:GreA/GreB family elongation factor [Draconibacterium orientale]AHW58563.1 GreA/GreB family elongation factor [Draconibacterium orientale]SEU13241.1 regulator of nucleoside diphosphate kinase [Draconibacterium orientale]